MITQRQARNEALRRASGAIQAYIDGGSVWEAYEHLPTEDIEHITKEVKKIMSSLEGKIDHSIKIPQEENRDSAKP